MNNNTQTAEQLLGNEQQATREPYLLFNDKAKADEYLRKIKSFGNQIQRFKPIFESIVTKNLNVTFSKKWLKIILDGNLEEKVNEALAEYLQSQPAMLQPTIYKEFQILVQDLYKPASLLKANFEQAVNQSAINYSPYPNGLDQLEAMPLNDNGGLTFTPQWDKQIRKQFEGYLTTDLDFAKYDALKACLKAQDEFKNIFGEKAPYVWRALNSNGFVTSNEVNNQFLNDLIAW